MKKVKKTWRAARSARTGRFVTVKYANRYPHLVVWHTYKKK